MPGPSPISAERRPHLKYRTARADAWWLTVAVLAPLLALVLVRFFRAVAVVRFHLAGGNSDSSASLAVGRLALRHVRAAALADRALRRSAELDYINAAGMRAGRGELAPLALAHLFLQFLKLTAPREMRCGTV